MCCVLCVMLISVCHVGFCVVLLCELRMLHSLCVCVCVCVRVCVRECDTSIARYNTWVNCGPCPVFPVCVF